MQRKLTPFGRKFRQFKHLAKKVNQLLSTGSFNELSQFEQISLASQLRHRYDALIGKVPTYRLKPVLATAALVLSMGFSTAAMAQSYNAPLFNPFGIQTGEGGLFFHSMADIDADGDMDIISAGQYGTINYFENTGSASAPVFGTPEFSPFGLVTEPGVYIGFPNFVDLDSDGDQDVVLGTYSETGGTIYYYENEGTAEAAEYGSAQQTPFGIEVSTSAAIPQMVDIDADGDMDLFYSSYDYATESTTIYYQENLTDETSGITFGPLEQEPFGMQMVGEGIESPAFVDVDGDGDLDYLGTYYGQSFYYMENTGSAEEPSFGTPEMNPFDLSAPVGEIEEYIYSPVHVDMDADGDMDIMVGGYYGFLFYENTGQTPEANLPPTLDAIENTETCDDGDPITINLSGITDGNPSEQSLSVTAVSSDGTILADPVVTYADGDETATLELTPVEGQTGTVTINVTVTDDGADENSVTQSFEVEVFGCTVDNISLDTKALEVDVYPNPTADILNLAMSNPTGEQMATLEIMNAVGQNIVSQVIDLDIDVNKFTIDMSDFNAGIYFVKVNVGEEALVKRVMKK